VCVNCDKRMKDINPLHTRPPFHLPPTGDAVIIDVDANGDVSVLNGDKKMTSRRPRPPAPTPAPPRPGRPRPGRPR